MNHSNSNRLRLTGKLIKGDRGFILQCKDESVWRLHFSDVDVPDGNEHVTVEGFKAGIDAIDVD